MSHAPAAYPAARRPLPAMLKPLLGSPELPAHMKALTEHWEGEQARRAAFRDRVNADEKQEFINGEIIMHSPARVRHNEVVAQLVQILGMASRRLAPGSKVYVEKAMVGCQRNDYEPDIVWYGPASAAIIKPEDVILHPPDLAIEVLSPSTENRDRGVKFQDYALNGIGEYWIIDADSQTVERYHLDPETRAYGPAETGPSITCRALPGLVFPVLALFDEQVLDDVLGGLMAPKG